MLSVLLSLAHATPPQATAIISSDGTYSIILETPVSWEAAEISVAGDGAEDYGPVQVGEELRIEGALERPGTLWINIQAAVRETADETTGIHWVFSVDPEVVPASSPRMERLSRRSLRWCPLRRRKG